MSMTKTMELSEETVKSIKVGMYVKAISPVTEKVYVAKVTGTGLDGMWYRMSVITRQGITVRINASKQIIDFREAVKR